MAEIINFEEYLKHRAKPDTKQETDSPLDDRKPVKIELPTLAEIVGISVVANAIAKSGDPLDIRLWTGDDWYGLFNNTIIPYADENKLDAWDVLAVVITKAYGTEFLKKEDGSFAGIQLS